jgi:hypothetical protein
MLIGKIGQHATRFIGTQKALYLLGYDTLPTAEVNLCQAISSKFSTDGGNSRNFESK